MVLDPVRIPPFLRIDLHAIQLHGEVDVIAAGHARHAAQAHHLAALHHVAFVHVDPAQVAVDGLQSVAVIDHDAVAVDAQRRRVDHLAVVRGLHADVLRDGEIVAEMDLLIDLLAVINVVAQIGKVRLGLRRAAGA